ncbi:MAG: tetratricopeptide repeat protein [Pseudomonadales bacterium]|nr:tetratricopeptide repeat protein [Pseudomonadales bacterium]
MNGTRHISRLGLVVLVVLCCIVLAASVVIAPERGFQVGTSLLLLHVLCSRLLFTGDHQLALWHQAQQEYELAIPRLEASLRYFERHPLLDRLRFLLLLSPTGYRYRELALLGLGHCNAQLGRLEAREYYEACLRLNPRNTTARAALVLMQKGAELARPLATATAASAA